MTAITSHRPQWSGRRQPRGETPATWPTWPLADVVLISKLGARASFLNSMTEPSVRLVAAFEKRRGFIYRCAGDYSTCPRRMINPTALDVSSFIDAEHGTTVD